jgi:hypothetical protein
MFELGKHRSKEVSSFGWWLPLERYESEQLERRILWERRAPDQIQG